MSKVTQKQKSRKDKLVWLVVQWVHETTSSPGIPGNPFFPASAACFPVLEIRRVRCRAWEARQAKAFLAWWDATGVFSRGEGGDRG